MTMDVTDGLVDDAAVSDDAADEAATPDEQEEPDPLTALAAQIEKDYGHLKGFDPNPLRAGMGRIPAIQSAVDDLKKNGPLTADVVERLDLTDKALGALAEFMANDPAQSESFRAPYRAYIDGMAHARSQRQEDALLDKLRAEITPAA